MCSLNHLIKTNVREIPLVELEFLGRKWLPEALRASPTVILAQGGRCFLIKSDVREFLWLACQGLAGLGLWVCISPVATPQNFWGWRGIETSSREGGPLCPKHKVRDFLLGLAHCSSILWGTWKVFLGEAGPSVAGASQRQLGETGP